MPFVLQRAIALVGLALLTPLIAALALAIRLDTPGPVLYRGRRIGLGGRAIEIHKLRTMHWRPQDPGPPLTGPADRRVTGLGRVLRRTRLDELPQLWDVVRGDLALVGPRPEAAEFVDLEDPRWQEVLTVRPGITGPTQLAFLDEQGLMVGGDPVAAYVGRLLPRKLESDLAYVRGRSLRLDASVLLGTLAPWLAFRRRNTVPPPDHGPE